MDDERKSDGSWWRTVPGMLTAAAGTITSTDGVATAVNAESLGNCIASSKELTLSSGQSIAFEKMRAFEFARDNTKPTLLISLLNGKTVQGSMNMGCELVAMNDLGRFNLSFDKVKRVEFKR
jgi:hypothetical protein